MIKVDKITVKHNNGKINVFSSGLAPEETITLLTKAIYTYADNQHFTPKKLAQVLHNATDNQK